MTQSPPRFSEIAHARLDFFGPYSWPVVDQFVEHLDLRSSSRVLDVGCGAGRLLIEIVRRFGCVGLGVDLSPAFIDRAGATARAQEVDARCRFVVGDAASVLAAEEPFDLALCLGSTHAFGGFDKTLEALGPLLRDDGRALIGEGYWKITPDPAYLEHLGASVGDLGSHTANIERAAELGYDFLWARESDLDEWDAYEGTYAAGVRDYVADNPDDPEGEAMLERMTRWNDAYRRWGRATLGFGLYLLRPN